jgi:transposase InsO family protein
MRKEFFRRHEREYGSLAELQAALDGWIVHYNTERPHQSLGPNRTGRRE